MEPVRYRSKVLAALRLSASAVKLTAASRVVTARHGCREGRDPGPDFQTDFYLEANPDVRANGANPLAHYLRYGRHEGRLAVRPA